MNEPVASTSIQTPASHPGNPGPASQVIEPISRHPSTRPLHSNERRGLTLLASALIGLLAVSAWLTPDPSGMGTHTQLGLPKCTMAAMTGLRCPGCGMTTAWALVMHGDVETALATNFGGTILCLLAILSVPILLGIAITGRTTQLGWFSKLAMSLVTIALAIAAAQWMLGLMWG